jgi:hypothetical protein
MVFKNKKSSEVEKGCPKNRLKGRQYFGRYNRGNGIGRIMKAINKIEDQCQYYNDYYETHKKF